jgi:hypothetical protein
LLFPLYSCSWLCVSHLQELQHEIDNFGKQRDKRIKAATDKIAAAKKAFEAAKKALKVKQSAMQVGPGRAGLELGHGQNIHTHSLPAPFLLNSYQGFSLLAARSVRSIAFRSQTLASVQATLAEAEAADGERKSLGEQLAAAKTAVKELQKQVS